MSEDIRHLIQYRLQMARDTLDDAVVLLREGRSSWSVVNRAYYAMFYAVLALLVSIGEGSAKHTGVIALFDKHFIKTGRLPADMSRWLHRAFDLRQRADYREMVRLDPEQVDEVVRWAHGFVAQVVAFLTPSIQDGGGAG